MNGFKSTEAPENTQNFGSTCNRFEIKKEPNELGPGSYYQKPVKKKQRSISTAEAPFNSQSKRNSMFGMAEVVPHLGPGCYNPKKDPRHHQRSYSCKNVMVNNEKRFTNSKFKLKTPGPGNYVLKDDWNKLNSNEIIHMLNPQGVNAERLVISQNPETIPPVGSYNSDMITNLDYKVAKKVNKLALINAPFNSFSKRFKDQNENVVNLGPGAYLKLDKAQKEQVYPPFKESDERFKIKRGQNFNLGPGLYNPHNATNWNKRTYNVIYIDNKN